MKRSFWLRGVHRHYVDQGDVGFRGIILFVICLFYVFSFLFAVGGIDYDLGKIYSKVCIAKEQFENVFRRGVEEFVLFYTENSDLSDVVDKYFSRDNFTMYYKFVVEKVGVFDDEVCRGIDELVKRDERLRVLYKINFLHRCFVVDENTESDRM